MNNPLENGNMGGDDLDLGEFGASGFSLKTRLDFSGHRKGTVDPHVNSDLVNPDDDILGGENFRDLSNNQMPGFNGMQGS